MTKFRVYHTLTGPFEEIEAERITVIETVERDLLGTHKYPIVRAHVNEHHHQPWTGPEKDHLKEMWAAYRGTKGRLKKIARQIGRTPQAISYQACQMHKAGLL